MDRIGTEKKQRLLVEMIVEYLNIADGTGREGVQSFVT